MSGILENATNAVKSSLYAQPKEPEDWIKWQDAEQPVPDEERKM